MGLFVDPYLGLDTNQPELRLRIHQTMGLITFFLLSCSTWSFLQWWCMTPTNTSLMACFLAPVPILIFLIVLRVTKWLNDHTVPMKTLEWRINLIGNVTNWTLTGSCMAASCSAGLYKTCPEIALILSSVTGILFTNSRTSAVFSFISCTLFQVVFAILWSLGNRQGMLVRGDFSFRYRI